MFCLPGGFKILLTVFNQSYNCQTSHYLGRKGLPNAFLMLPSLGRPFVMLLDRFFVGYIYQRVSYLHSKLYIPSTLNIDLILWYTQLIVCAENVKSWFKSWVFPFTFQAYILSHTLNCMCVSLFIEPI
jgi:hypothetical protein